MNSMVRSNNTLFPTIPSLFDDFFTSDWLDPSRANLKASVTTLPAVNEKDSNDDFQIEVAAPGMKRDDFKVELDNNLLTISSKREEKNEQKDENGNYTRGQFSY